MGRKLVALSGPDNVGKTTQLRLLTNRSRLVTALGGTSHYHPDWQTVVEPRNGAWWFESETDDHIRFIFEAYVKRQAVTVDTAFVALDRGPNMFVAVCAATMITKTKCTVPEAVSYVQSIVEREFSIDPAFEILLLPSDNAHALAAFSLAKEAKLHHGEYIQYQRNLADCLLHLASANAFQFVANVQNQSIVSVQNLIRRTLQTHLSLQLPELFGTLETAWLIGGLSESGKSTAAALLRKSHGFSRLKFEYFSYVDRVRLAKSADEYYSMSGEEIAESLLLGIDDFLRHHPFIRAISLESLHRFEVARFFKAALGERVQILYLDTPNEVRRARAVESLASLAVRDTEKIERGAKEIARIADTVIMNTGDKFALSFALSRQVAKQRPHTVLPADGTLPVNLPERVEALLIEMRELFSSEKYSNVIYACATGSIASDRWVPNWSDVDVLLIVRRYSTADFSPVQALVERANKEFKVSLSIVLWAEAEAGLIASSILHRLRRAAEGNAFVLACKEDPILPVLTAELDAEASKNDLSTAVVHLRRYNSFGGGDVQQIFKQAGVLAKIILRTDGIDIDAEEDAIRVLLGRSDDTRSCSVPSKREMAGKQGEYRDAVKEVARAVLLAYERAVVSGVP